MSGIFLEIGSLVLFKTQNGARGPCGIVCGKARFPFGQKMNKNGQNSPPKWGIGVK